MFKITLRISVWLKQGMVTVKVVFTSLPEVGRSSDTLRPV